MTSAEFERVDWFQRQKAPHLAALVHRIGRSGRAHNRRRLILVETPSERAEHLLDTLPELRRRTIADALEAQELATLGRLANGGSDATRTTVLPVVQNIVERRWTQLGPAVVATVLLDPHHGEDVLKAFPKINQTTEFIDGLAEAQAEGVLQGLVWRLDLTQLAPPSREQLRQLLPALKGQYDGDPGAQLLAAAARREGWTPWLLVFGVLLHGDELARERAPSSPPDRSSRSWHGDAHEPVRQAVWTTLRSSKRARAIGRLLEDLDDALADAPRDLWETYAEQVKATVGDDPAWRAAAVEALLWCRPDRNRRLAVFTADALSSPADLPVLEALFDHPHRRTAYEARALATEVAQRRVATPRAFGAERPPALVGRAGEATGLANTWIGQAVVEQLIAEEVGKLEEQFARAYPDHHRDGEEKLGERFFATLGVHMRLLSDKLAAMARESGAVTRSEVLVRYRPVDKPEEGAAGVERPEVDGAPKKFSTDLCLVVEATLNGEVLAKRATLVQAKRLYAADNDDPSAGWDSSFDLKPEQTDALLKQTESSFYLFQGPGIDGRGLPIVPVRLVNELATLQGAGRTRISTNRVGRASQSFAEWFTYELVALRTGDPCQPLVDKAMGGPGSVPYDLARFGVVKVEVKVGEPVKAEG